MNISIRHFNEEHYTEWNHVIPLLQEYQIYLACADDGKGNEIMTGKPLKTYEEWIAS